MKDNFNFYTNKQIDLAAKQMNSLQLPEIRDLLVTMLDTAYYSGRVGIQKEIIDSLNIRHLLGTNL